MPAVLERPSRSRAIPVRRLDVDLASVDVPRWTVDGDPIFSHLLATLSAAFPRGEEFFVTTVRQHRSAAADDPVLRAQVKAFAGQEAMHGREHRTLNGRLHDLGYRTEEVDRGIDRILAALLRLKPSTLPLAVTAASEHFTGILAEVALGHEESRDVLFGDPQIQSLIVWHAVEELEHKNVAFDVLDRAGGGYAVRVAGAAVAAAALGAFVAVEWARGVVDDRSQIRGPELRRFLRNLRRQRLLSPWALRRALRYLRPGFHPDDMDTDALVTEWQARLATQTTVTAGMR